MSGIDRDGERSGPGDLRTAVVQLFSIDLRTLGLYRIGLGCVLLADLYSRSGLLRAAYSDAGAVPRQSLLAPPIHFAWHFFDGAVAWEVGLFALAGLFGLLLVLGWNTRKVLFVCWLLLVSMQVRNPFLNDGGDPFLRMQLFWGLFLPLGARFSLDARSRGGDEDGAKAIFSAGTVAILVQLVLFYVASGLNKSGPEWMSGEAVALALGNTYWARPLGEFLLEYPIVTSFLTYATLFVEIAVPFLLLVPYRIPQLRIATLLSFWALQGGLGAALELNFFPVMSTVATLVLLPSDL